MFDPYLKKWALLGDGEPLVTHTSRLLPVLKAGEPAMLKLCLTDEERRGSRLLEQWAGEGAARVFARDGLAVLMERATGQRDLANMARGGEDDVTCLVLCCVAQQLHNHRLAPSSFVPMNRWFRALRDVGAAEGGVFSEAAKLIDKLLEDQRDIHVLHGDLHHGNVLDFGARGWLAIDPKGLVGERAFEYVALFSNPDLVNPNVPAASDQTCFRRRVAIVAEAARLDRRRLLQWVFVGMGLSASWFVEENSPFATIPLTIAEFARVELNN
ncbi:APH(6) family putative aminoglycoside O-phosphotransferase [Qingshengfaniella alkalisoli]|uniref:APH(6) family putative aminoglycoside O-phosphotransferase n=2 Tax=Qingshengfaniella alkalisoli TaxID=2599296 RepID=A0A5B8J065_9RHOB|nr:APH(6) family putative aminoglycoside O-phosphotransferase [Qingshengfaniella alkalisoli]